MLGTCKIDRLSKKFMKTLIFDHLLLEKQILVKYIVLFSQIQAVIVISEVLGIHLNQDS